MLSIYRNNSEPVTNDKQLNKARKYIARLDKISIQETVKLDAYYISKNKIEYIGYYNLPFKDFFYSGCIVTNCRNYVVFDNLLQYYVLLNRKRKVIKQGKTYFNAITPDIEANSILEISNHILRGGCND